MNLVLIGFMGSGKTILAKKLSEKLKYNYIDSDLIIERKMKMFISEIFLHFGETFFRHLERLFLLSIENKNNIIFSTGGGMPCYKNNIEILKDLGLVVYIKIPKNRLYKIDKTNRPLLKKGLVLLEKRKYCYQKANYVIENVKLKNSLETLEKLAR